MTEEMKKPWVTHWGADPYSWNIHEPEDDDDSDGSYMPGRELVRGAVARWAMAQPAGASLAADVISTVFNLPIHLAEDAIGGVASDLDDAVQVWTGLQDRGGRDCTVGEVAAAFLLKPEEIVAAVEGHYWMYLTGDRADVAGMLIGHEGE
ncbi:hypothetical protein [Sphingobium sp. MI1205]|uniref:hypothetical protein n=1 Tax=Sphingobium sp. MI1205 TaxID=407020 RepID=UPI000770336E|nr:hypothetical protein [Sphingobium sp. MI1205]AMK18715.1 hypothetical protein K663_11680 [Sphingobium sp. MI1205]